MMCSKSGKNLPSFMGTLGLLLVIGSTSSWAFPHAGGGFHGHGGFGGGGFPHNYGGGYHPYGGYHAGGYSREYRGGVESYHGPLGPSPFGHMHQFHEHPQAYHSFNHAPVVMNHPRSVYYGRGIHREFAGHANWANHGYWHGGYWHGSYGHYWVGGAYWGGGHYWGGSYWGSGFFYGAFFGAALTTAFFLPPVYATYYYPSVYYYPGPYSYTVIVNDYPPVPAPPLRLPPQKVETWVSVKNGHIPVNAVVNNHVHKQVTYYCRVSYNGKISYGVLVPKEGCYVEKPSVSMRFSKYDVLVSSIIG